MLHLLLESSPVVGGKPSAERRECHSLVLLFSVEISLLLVPIKLSLAKSLIPLVKPLEPVDRVIELPHTLTKLLVLKASVPVELFVPLVVLCVKLRLPKGVVQRPLVFVAPELFLPLSGGGVESQFIKALLPLVTRLGVVKLIRRKLILPFALFLGTVELRLPVGLCVWVRCRTG